MIRRHSSIPLILLVFTIAFYNCERGGISGPTSEQSTSPSSIEEINMVINPPAIGEHWKPGTNNEIKWKVLDVIKFVDLELHKKGYLKLKIISRLDNKGSYIWSVPTDIQLSHHYQIKIIDSENSNRYNFSERFFILND